MTFECVHIVSTLDDCPGILYIASRTDEEVISDAGLHCQKKLRL